MAKKKVNFELMLTPFIDLFGVLVSFLLMTAVWNHLAILSTDTAAVTSSDEPPPVSSAKKVMLSVTVLPDRIELAEDERGTNIPHLSTAEVNKDRLIEILQDWKNKYPDRSDVVLNTENSVPYQHLIAVFDTLVGNGWPDVGVSTQ